MTKKSKTPQSSIAERMHALFAGYSRASGTHGEPNRDPNGLKWAIKKTAKTINSGPTAAMWAQHIAGTRPLGVVPIRDDDTCVWGSIDIDKYDVDHLAVIARVDAMKLPLVPCRSKSNGLHLFLFMREPTQAAIVQLVLRNLAAIIGFADSEIFPKQTGIKGEQGDSGSWMVMPYFGGDFGGKLKMQYGLKKTGAEMTIEEFLSAAERAKVTEDHIAELRQRSIAEDKPATNGSGKKGGHRVKKAYGDGPPCLQFMAETGFPEGGRNNALLHIGVYLKRAFPADWKNKLMEDNQKYMRPPLPTEEVHQVQRQLEKKEYEYLCKHQPMSGHCDSVTCRTRKYGVGNEAYPEILAIRKLLAEPAVWFVDVMGTGGSVTLMLKTEELQYFNRFQTACMEYASVMQRNCNPALWTAILQEAMAKLEEIEAPPDLQTGGGFREMLETFLTNRTKGTKKEDILRGAPWEDEETGRHYFRLSDLKKFLEREGVKMSRTEITMKIRAVHGDAAKDAEFYPHEFFRIKDKGVNVWWVDGGSLEPTPELEAPELPREHI